MAAADRRCGGVRFERSGNGRARAFQRRRQPEQNAGKDGNEEYERKYPEVWSDVKNKCAVLIREGIRDQYHRCLQERPTKQEREDTRDQAEQCALREQLANET